MNKKFIKIFTDKNIVCKIQKRLPYLFQLAELDNLRDGKLGMEVGSTRERVLISLLIWLFGYENVKLDVPIAQKEIDVYVFNKPLSIKTFTRKNVRGVKLMWTVDDKKVKDFIQYYKPTIDLLLVRINWKGLGGLYFISQESQEEVLDKLGRSIYFKVPSKGTNSRGIEISRVAIKELLKNQFTYGIDVFWDRKSNLEYNPYEKWIKLWKQD